MAKKGLLMLVILTVAAGGVFAQTNFASMPKNTLTVDVGPTIVGLGFGLAANFAVKYVDIGDMNLDSSGFGIAAQYERQILEKVSVAARFAYLGLGVDMGGGFSESSASADISVGMDLKAISGEGHFRFYPAGKTFFLGGMLGYGNLAMDFSGTLAITESTSGYNENQSVSFNGPRHYAKVGARLGWRIDFGSPGGFVFEPSVGYDHAIGFGDTFGKRLQDAVGGDLVEIADIDQLDSIFKIVENYALVGGPRVTLSFGWRF